MTYLHKMPWQPGTVGGVTTPATHEQLNAVAFWKRLTLEDLEDIDVTSAAFVTAANDAPIVVYVPNAGMYAYNPSSTLTPDGIFVLAPNSGSGNWERAFAADQSSASGAVFVQQASHGFAVGDVIRYNGTVWTKAQGNSIQNCTDCWFVFASPDTGAFRAAKAGRLTVPGHGLAVGTLYYLSASSPGVLTATKPIGTVSQPLGFFLPFVFVESSSVLHVLGNSYPTMTELLAEYTTTSNETTVTFSNLAGIDTDGAYRINADLVAVSSTGSHFVNFKVNNVNPDAVQITESSNTTVAASRLTTGFGFIRFSSTGDAGIADVLINRVTTRGYLIQCNSTSSTSSGSVVLQRNASGYISETAEINSIAIFTNFSNELGTGSKIRLLRSRW